MNPIVGRLVGIVCLCVGAFGCSEGGDPIVEGTVKSLIVRDRPVELNGIGNWTFMSYAGDGKTRVSVYPEFIIVHQSDNSDRVVPHGWYEILEIQ